MLEHCFAVLFLVLQARCATVLPPQPQDGSYRALQIEFAVLQNSAELEEMECENSGLNFCIQGPLVQLAELQDMLNVTLVNQTTEEVPAVLTELAAINTSVLEIPISIHLLSSSQSQINNSLIWSEKLFTCAQESIPTLEQLLADEFPRAPLVNDRVRSITAMTTLGLKKASAFQEHAIVLLRAINMTIFEVVATRTQVQCGLLVLNTSSLQDGEEAFNPVTELVNATLIDATTALQLSKQYHSQTSHTLTNFTTLLSVLAEINSGLIGVTELEIAVNTSNTSSILTETVETLAALLRKIEAAQSLSQSVLERINSTETSLATAFISAIETEKILNKLSILLLRVEEEAVELGDLNQEFMQQILERASSVDMMEQHAILLFVQKELLKTFAEDSGVLDCPTEFDRLAKIQSVANNSVTLSEKVIQTRENTIPAVVEHVAEVAERASAVTVLVNTTNSKNSDLLLRIDTVIQAIAKCSTKLEERKNTLRAVNRTVNQTSTEIRQIEMQVELLDAQAVNIGRSFFASSVRTERADVLGSAVESILEGIPCNVGKAEDCINSTKSKFGTIELRKLEVQNRTRLLGDSLQAVESSLLETRRIAEAAEQSVQSILQFLNTNNVPLRIQDDIVPAVDVNLNATNENQELRSVSLTVELTEVQDSILLHLTNLLESVDQNTSLTVGVLNGSLVAAFVQAHPVLTAGNDVVELTISETNIQPFTKYKMDATRTATNTHLLLREMETGNVYSASAMSSSRISFYFRISFLQNAQLYVGGAVQNSNLENTPFVVASNSTGCVNRVTINGIRVDLWNTLTLKTGVQPCTNSSLELAAPLHLSLNGQQYSHDLLEDGNIFPVHLSFRTLLPNGQLLLARNFNQETQLEVVLNRGHLVVRVSAGSRSRTLTSLELYNNGSTEAVTITLTASQRGLILLSELEETRRGLINIGTDEVLNYTEVFIGGTPQEIENQLELGNFSGCARVLLPANPISEIPMCSMNEETSPCFYCTDQAVLSAAFYGASYAEFPSISIGDYFDLSFNLRTAFGDGIIAFAGDSSQGDWIAVVLTNSRITLVFRSGSSGVSLPLRSAPLDDDEWHEVVIVRAHSDLNFLIDGISAGVNPFGGLLPSGNLGTNLYIGGISPESENLLPSGMIDNDGFKGCLDGVRVLGRPLDFSMNVGLGGVALDVCLRTSGNEDQDVYTFAGSAFATYDLGRFGSNFSVGFQFRTNRSSGLLLLAFSMNRADALAVQIVDGKIQFYIRSELTEAPVTADVVISDGQWHTARVEKLGRSLRVVVDGVVGMVTGAPEEELRTTSLLYIGGLPDDIGVPVPESVTSQGFFGCLRIRFLSQSLLTNVLANQCQFFSTE